jgi:hypothetical protein
MLKPTAATARSPQRAQKQKKKPSPRLTEAPVQSQAAKAAKDAGIWAPSRFSWRLRGLAASPSGLRGSRPRI